MATLTLRRGDGNRLLEAELEQGFAGNLDLLAFGQNLHPRARGSSGCGTNGGALATARDGADDGSGSGDPAYFLSRRGALAFAFQRVIAAHHGVVFSINHYARELELEFGLARKGSAFLGIGEPAVDVGSFAGHHDVVHVQIRFETRVENIADMILGGIHPVDHADKKRLPGRNVHLAAWRHSRWSSGGRGSRCWLVGSSSRCRSGSRNAAGPTIAGGMLFVGSGYGVVNDTPGNVLLAFAPE